MLEDESERSKARRKEFEKFSREALAYFIVHEVLFMPSEPVETLQEIERNLTSDRLVKRMKEVSDQLQGALLYGNRKSRNQFFKLQDEFDSISKRLDRIHRQREAAWEKRRERWAVEKKETVK